MTIDRSIIYSACLSALRRFKREWICEPLSKFPVLSVRIKTEVINSIWNKALEANGAYNYREPATNAEAAVAAGPLALTKMNLPISCLPLTG